MTRQTVQEYIAASQQWLKTLDAAVFTTFTFDPAFFENNTLPLLFDVKDTSEFRRRVQVNNALQRTDIAVFYDKNHSVRHSGRYRYQVTGVKLKSRFFHPKLIILSGEMEDGNSGVIVAVLSANITLNGWGRQEEVLATLFIESGRQAALIESLSDFLSFLEKTTDQNYGAIEGVRKALKNLPSDRPLTQVVDPETELYFGGIGKRQSFQEALAGGKMVQRWDRLTVFSPYWHNVVEEAKKFPVREYVFIPTRNERGRYTLTHDQARSLLSLDSAESVAFRDFREYASTKGMFRHAKAYFLQKDWRVKVGVGSCNFTSAGLDGENGNVEAMLIFTVNGRYLRTEIESDLKDIKINEETAETDSDDDAPEQIPFDITVVYDWGQLAYLYTYKPLAAEIAEAQLYLPGVRSPIVLSPATPQGRIETDGGVTDIGEFHVTYRVREEKKPPYYGAILEINLSASKKDYIPRLSTEDILESWRACTTDIPLQNYIDRVEDESEEERISGVSGNEEKLGETETFNFYDDFRALYDLRSKLSDAKRSKQDKLIEGYLEFRPDSVRRLLSNLPSITSLERRYCLARELFAIIEEYRRYLKDTTAYKEIYTVLNVSRQELLLKLQAELLPLQTKGVQAEDLLKWFELNMKES